MPSDPDTTAVVYARISDDKRRGTEDEGKSVDAQIRECKAYIERKGWKLGKVYRDDHRPATKKDPRPAFEEMLRDTPPVVVYWQQTRLERANEHTNDLDRFLALGLEGYGVDGTRVTMESASAELMTRFGSLIAGYEGKLRKERQKLRYRSDAEEGKAHLARPVFGNDYKTGDLVPDEAEAIQKAAKGLAEGTTTFYATAKAWNAAGLRTPKSKGMGGKHWEAGTVRQFFQRERLIGKRTYNGKTYELEGWTAILDKDTFDRIQDLIQANKTGKAGIQGNRHRPHLLTGIATCGMDDCGKGMNIGYRGDKNSPRYYKCTTPNHLSRTAAPLEKYVVRVFLDLLMYSGAQELLNPGTQGKGIAELRSRKLKATREHNAWLEEAGKASIPTAAIAARHEAHTAEMADIGAALFEYEKTAVFAFVAEDIIKDGPQALWGRWESMPVDRQRRVVQALFEEIRVDRAPQGARFSGKYVRLVPTKLHLQLVDLTLPDDPGIPLEDLPQEVREQLAPQ